MELPMNDRPLARHIALVTGASSGIGAASAVALAGAGATVAVNHLAGDEDAANAVVARIEKAGGKAVPVAGDVSVEADVRKLFGDVIAQFGTLHVLVNNAGIQRDAAVLDMTLDDWQKVIGVNLTGQFLCAREAAREFVRRGIDENVSSAAGKIVCMSSVHQTIPWAQHVNYAASKGGVQMLMESLAQELAPQRIRVNSIAPGAIRTHINQAAWQTPQAEHDLLGLIPYGRIGSPEDVARAVVWLASDASDYVTGSTLVVDGGMMLYPGFRKGG
jgi:glucose 1-dehydrogenase